MEIITLHISYCQIGQKLFIYLFVNTKEIITLCTLYGQIKQNLLLYMQILKKSSLFDNLWPNWTKYITFMQILSKSSLFTRYCQIGQKSFFTC